MTPQAATGRQELFRAFLLSLFALAVPVTGAFFVPDTFSDYEALLWLIALIPAFLLAYHRGWRGAATALALGMAVLSVTYAVTRGMGRTVPPLLFGVVVFYIVLALMVGWLAERLHRRVRREQREGAAFVDPLTGLPNRRHAELHLDIEFNAAERGRALVLVHMALDDFREYIARNGTTAGDEVLRVVAEVLKQNTRRMNLSARYADDEFLCILGSADEQGALIFLTRLQSALRNAASAVELPSMSTGIAIYREETRSAADLLADSTDALRQAQRDGGGRVRIAGRPVHVLLPKSPAPNASGPSQALTAGSDAASGAAPAPARGTPRRALIVVEEDGLRAQLARHLADQGFKVAQVANASGSIQSLTVEYDLLVTDLALSEGGAPDVIRIAKLRWPHIQVIGLAHTHEPAGIIAAVNAGADRVLPKPLEPTALRQYASDLLMRRDLLDTTAVETRQLTLEATAEKDQAVSALRRSEATSRALLSALPDQVFALGRNGVFLSCEGAEDGQHEGAAWVGHAFEEVLPDTVARQYRQALEEVFESGRTQVVEYELETRAGVQHFEARFALRSSQEAVVIVRDTSDRRRLEEQLRASQKLEAIGRLAGGLAHDFNNLLTVVQGNAHLLLEEFADEPLALTLAGQIDTAAERGAHLVRQLLAFGRKQVLQPRMLSLNSVVNSVQTVLPRLIGESVRIELELDPELGLVRADPGQVEQVLVSLAAYAKERMPGGGTLRLTTTNARQGVDYPPDLVSSIRDTPLVLLTLSDTGTPLAPDTRERLFEPFFDPQPTGIGSQLELAAVYGIILQSGGVITVDDTPTGGNAFRILLPRVDL